MYQAFYGLQEAPFTIAPNPKYLFLSQQHQQAVTHLQYCLTSGGGFVLLTGEVGTGKTTLTRTLLEQLNDTTDVASILNPSLNELDVLATICDELTVSYPAAPSLKELIDRLKHFLLANHQQGRQTLLVIDEAQHLTAPVLEQLRLLTNVETDETKLLQIMLIGQPELQQHLKKVELRQLAQRITARYHLMPLDENDVSAYIAHRLSIAGRDSALFTKAACRRIYQRSHGIARLINVICDKALLQGHGDQLTEITPQTVDAVTENILAIAAEQAPHSSFVKALPWLTSVIALGLGYIATTSAIKYTKNTNEIIVHTSPTVTPVVSTAATLNRLLSQARSHATAMSGLMGLWGTSHGAGGDGCMQALTYGLRCFTGTGWSELRYYNLPAVIRLKEGANIYFAVVINIANEQSIRIQLNTTQLNVSKAWLLDRLHGEFTLLWQPSFKFSHPLRVGNQGEGVLLLSQLLHRLYDNNQLETDVYNDELRKLVMRFQRENHLMVDGIAGEKTFIRLYHILSQHALTLQGTQS